MSALPSIIAPPLLRRRRRLGPGYLVWGVFAVIAVLFLGSMLIDPLDPPKEKELLERFRMHRPVFEQLRDMLQADTRLSRVAAWGVETRDPFFLGYPTETNFSMERYQVYLSLLNKVGGGVASRNTGEPADPGVTLWGWGWAGNSKHIGLCWLETAPTNIIPTLDGYHYNGRYEDRQPAYRHIDQKWYFWTDL